MILNHIDQITSIQKIDIAQSEEMVEEYGVRIPVLRVQSGEELEWPFDQGQVLNFIKSE